MHAVDGLKEVSATLERYGIEEAHKESEIIFTSCLGMERVGLYRDNPCLSKRQEEELRRILERRARREPIQYIVGHVDFCGLRIEVGPGVLIPRPETEFIVEEVINAVCSRRSIVEGQQRREAASDTRLSTGDGQLRILDLCTGSGCIALALARELPDSEVIGVDISEKALEYARKNGAINGIENVTFLKGDLFGPAKGIKFDIIVSNPPYVRRSEIDTLQPEIRKWEPVEALDGGEDGLAFYGKILPLAGEYLDDGGFIVIELGYGESEDVVTMARNSGFKPIAQVRDYAGIDRFLRLSRS